MPEGKPELRKLVDVPGSMADAGYRATRGGVQAGNMAANKAVTTRDQNILAHLNISDRPRDAAKALRSLLIPGNSRAITGTPGEGVQAPWVSCLRWRAA